MIKDFSSHEFWGDFCDLYMQAKKYLLLIEEMEPQHSTVIQPIKEQRDALDHIVRAYDLSLKKESCSCQEEIERLGKCISEEFERSKGHIERAINDCADILSIILREKISAYLSDFSYKEVLSKWNDYPIERKFLIRVDEKIADLRNRDINAKNRINEYDAIINKLKDIYYKVTEEIYPQLC